ncbi:DnaB-like helicase N-terminal domain-containing protein [Streptomyces sp. NPDC019443]|uniref:DnaB-like helicase N-terminal domain-containing protein n=1 Tax=Streptomyces sp. NPDC019443 TaxID=3365061 RepID=UPI003796777E
MTDTPPPGDDLWDTVPNDVAAITRMQPHDPEAEMSVLGSCMINRDVLRHIIDTLAPEDFYQPRHATLLTAIATMHALGEPVDQLTLIHYLEQAGSLERIGGRSYVFDLVQAVPTVALAPWYADRILALALRRAVAAKSTALTNEALSGTGEATDLVERAVADFRDIRDRGMASSDDHVPNIDEFLSVEQTHDWLIPGLLERRDRIVFTGAEGAGKSVLSRQMAVCISAGIHPFTHAPIETGPGTVLVFDCENGQFASARHYRPLRQLAQRHTRGAYDPNRLRILCRPEGLDLTRPADRSFVMRKVEKIQPDFMVIGPIYRLHAGDPNSEELARKVSVVIDEARATSGCAVWMEAHAPHQNGFSNQRALRPLGSSLWMRWPEFGYGIRLADDEMAKKERLMNVVSWRGPREERSWPVQIKQGADWPWVRYDPHAGSGWGAA